VNSYELEADACVNALAVRGHRRVSSVERARLLCELEGSALTLKAFAAQNGINYYTLVGWRQARRKQSGLAQCQDIAAGDHADCDLADCGDHDTKVRVADKRVADRLAGDQNARLKPAVRATAMQSTEPLHFNEVCLSDAQPPSTSTRATTPALLQVLPKSAVAVLPMPELIKTGATRHPPQTTSSTTNTTTTNPPTPIEVTLRGGAVVRSADVAQLAELLQLLGN
jgi:hypothetical protein